MLTIYCQVLKPLCFDVVFKIQTSFLKRMIQKNTHADLFIYIMLTSLRKRHYEECDNLVAKNEKLLVSRNVKIIMITHNSFT